MIRHVHHSSTYTPASRTAVSAASRTTAKTDSFQSLFASSSTSSATSSPAQITATVTKEAAKPLVLSTPQYEFGPSVSNPDGSVALLNYTEFADADTAQQIATKLGGTVTISNMDGYSAPQRSISVAGSPNLVNAGIAARLFAQYGDKPGSQAWQIINRDLGRDPMST